MKILYIGNFLKEHEGKYAGPNELLVSYLLGEGHVVKISGRRIKQLFRLLEHFRALIQSKFNNFNLVIIDVFSTRAYVFAYLSSIISWILNIKYILILHGGNLPVRFTRNRKISNFILKRALYVVSPSKYLAVKTEELFDINVTVIPNFIELYHLPKKSRSKNEIIWVRSFKEIYNPYMAIKVIDYLVKKGYTKFHLTMVGPISESKLREVNRYIDELNLSTSITLTGKISRKEWHSLAMKKSIFINTTSIDNTPSSVIEAMALGLIVVSTNVGGIPFLIDHNSNGILVENNDHEGMAKEILRIYENQDFEGKLRNISQFYFDKNFNDENISHMWKEIIHEI